MRSLRHIVRVRFWRIRRPRDREGWLTWAARFGYAACGTLYMVIGIAAVAAALGLKTDPTGTHGVLHFFASLPFGQVLLAGLCVGLAGYAALNFAGAVRDPERRGVTASGLLSRALDVLTGVLYVVLAITALALIVDPSHRANTATRVAERLLQTQSGDVILWMIGFAFLASCAYLVLRSANEPFGEMLDRRTLSSVTRRAIAIAARIGTVVRGVIFAICGFIVIDAARGNGSHEIGDIGQALTEVGDASFGPLLLGVAGAGFVAYGAYQLAKARYQRIGESEHMPIGSWL